MSALVRICFLSRLPDHEVARITGGDDDGSDGWYDRATAAIERDVLADPARFLEYADEPDVQATL